MRTVPADMTRKLVDGADRLTASFDDVRMDDIAKASGIPRATLYYYFPGKNDVLTFLHDTMLTELRENVRARDEGTTRDRLAALFASSFGHVARHPGLARILVTNLGRLGKLEELASATFYDPVAVQVEEVLRAGVRLGEVRDLDVERVAAGLSALAHITATRALVAGGLDDPEHLAEWLVDLAWAGVRAAG